jgi:Planctomycete cytochrome C
MKFPTKILVFSFAILALASCKHEPFLNDQNGSGNPTDTTGGTGVNGAICFESDILPIFASSCAISGCHNAATATEGYVLDSYNNIIKKGLKPGNAASSKIYEVLLKTGSERMPPPPNAALTTAQKNLVAKWINDGAKNTSNCSVAKCDTATVTYSKTIAPIIANNCVGCHNSSLQNGGFDFTNYTGVKQAVTLGRLVGAINYQPGFSGMPQGYRLSECQSATIIKWVKAGAINN